LSDLQPVRGTHDFLPDDMLRFRRVVETARAVAERYGYLEMATPIFEFSEVFKRTLGDTSDIVTKEMYTFTDKGGETLTLRPEGTAGIMRALISGGLSQHLPLKYFTYGPMFRYERPQKGRMRQFHQLDIELLGVAQPAGDVEVIACGAAILRELEILDRTVLELNTLGDSESRAAYRGALVDYFTAHNSKLSQDSRDRLTRNPLRILDSKDEGDRELIKRAPVFGEFLNQISRDFFATVKGGLDTLDIAYQVNPRLVRGLDYYCHTAFEFTTTELGSQGTVLGGGRYDGLAALMGAQSTAGIGWAAGIERLSMMLAQGSPARRPIAVVPIGSAAETKAAVLAERLRRAGHAIDLAYKGNIVKRLNRANKLSARFAIILGEDELAKGVASLRDLDSGEQTAVPLAELEERLARFR
jgi:histidyl-tRNA synthetase